MMFSAGLMWPILAATVAFILYLLVGGGGDMPSLKDCLFSIIYNPLLDSWLIVAPQRCNRPWQGQTESAEEDKVPQHDPTNPLCPGVVRGSGITTPQYLNTHVFNNDFPSLIPDAPDPPKEYLNGGDTGLFKASAGRGTCKVMCFHPHSNLQLATMKHDDVVNVIKGWQKELKDLVDKWTWVQVFENKGAIMGCSNPHPHCQIWASQFMPHQPAIKDRTQKMYLQKHGRPMLVDYLKQELAKKERIVIETTHWVVLVPFWAVWPYETMLLPKRHVLRLNQLNDDETHDLATAMQALLTLYDNLFLCTFAYSMGWHGAPGGDVGKGDCTHWQLHAMYLPPLLRSSTVRKFMAGYEMVCEPQRDITPEAAAKTLRELPKKHFKMNLYYLYSRTKLGLWYHKRQLRKCRHAYLDTEGHTTCYAHSVGDIQILPVPTMQDNYSYVIIDKLGGTVLVIDVADGVIMHKVLKENFIKPTAILTTHKHWDHCGGVKELLDFYPGTPVYGSSGDKPYCVNHFIQNDDVLEFGSVRIRCMLTPGHTKGHMVYLLQPSDSALPQSLFAGDLLFLCGCGKNFEGSSVEMLRSLEKMCALKDNTLIWPGHEYARENVMFAIGIDCHNNVLQNKMNWVFQQRVENLPTCPSTLGEEKEYNPFLRCGQESLVNRLGMQLNEKQSLADLNARAIVFQRLRLLKNQYHAKV